MKKTAFPIGAGLLVLLWAVLCLLSWFGPAKAQSDAERRPLAQVPPFSVQTLLDGSYIKDLETACADQFPLRDTFRRLKALFSYKVLQQKDNNDIYLAGDHAAKLLYPVNQKALDMNLQKLEFVYETYLKDTGSNIYLSVVPDKSYYLAQPNGYPALDYDRFFDQAAQAAPWADYIDMTGVLDIDDYYRTDLHWRQENLLPVAQLLSRKMGLTLPQEADFTVTAVEKPFYGVYYGQAALPLEGETLYWMRSELIDRCTVYDHESGKTVTVYDESKLSGRDLYDTFLSGARGLLTIENPNAKTDRELLIFRDSFASSLAPLLLQDYAKVTLIDIRYVNSRALGHLVEFTGQDVLFLYCTTVLNTEGILK